MGYRGIIVSKQTTNLIKRSRTSARQSIVGVTNTQNPVTAENFTVTSGQVYTMTVWGKKGSVALSGAGTGTVVDGTPVTFTASTNTLTVTVTGWLLDLQLEAGSISTGRVRTTNDTFTRGADSFSDVTGLQAGGKFGASAGAVILDISKCVSNADLNHFFDIIQQGSTYTVNSISLVSNGLNTGKVNIRVYLAGVISEATFSDFNIKSGGKLGISWDATQLKFFVNGVLKHTFNQTIPGLMDKISYTATNNEVIYKWVHLFNTKVSDANMIIGTT